MKFVYLDNDRNIVSCDPDPKLPDNHPGYEFAKQSPSETHRLFLEAGVCHLFQKHVDIRWPWSRTQPICTPLPTPNQFLEQIPKKVPQRLQAIAFTEGYGMQAVAGISVIRLLLMFLVWNGGSIAFMIFWLSTHHGDPQNAFTVVATTLAGFMIYLEILVRFQK